MSVYGSVYGATSSDPTLTELCEAIESLEGLLNSGATSVTQDGQTVAFDHDSARRRLRELYNQKAKLEEESTGEKKRKRRTLVNRIKLS